MQAANAAASRRRTAQYQDITRHFPAAPTSADNLRKPWRSPRSCASPRASPAVMALVSAGARGQSERGRERVRVELRAYATEISPTARATRRAPAAPRPGAPPPAAQQSAFISRRGPALQRRLPGGHLHDQRIRRAARQGPPVEEVRTSKLPLNVNPKAALLGQHARHSRTRTRRPTSSWCSC